MDNITKNRLLLFVLVLTIVGLGIGVFYGVSFYQKMRLKNNPQIIVEQNATSTSPMITQIIVQEATSTEKEIVGIKNVIEIYDLKENQIIPNVFTIKGKSAGWYFEGSFPIEVIDSKGKTIGISPAVAQTDWMTREFVEFKAMMSLSSTTSATGTIIFRKDNPSGEPQFDRSFSLPVKFKLSN